MRTTGQPQVSTSVVKSRPGIIHRPLTCLNRILPVELLAQIFLEGSRLKRGTDFLLQISHVSRYWRDTALATPSLWWDCYMSLGHGRPQNLDRGRAWLQRSRSTPVRIHFRFHQSNGPSSEQVPDSDLIAVFEMITQHLPHCFSLSLDNRGIAYLHYSIPLSLGHVFVVMKNNAPLLREYSFYGSGFYADHVEDLLPEFVMPLPNLPLQRLRICDDCSTNIDLSLVRNLTSFEYRRDRTWDREDGEAFGTMRMTVKDLLTIIRACPALKHLDVSDVAMDRRLHELPDEKQLVSAPHLIWMNLRFRSAMAMGQFIFRASFPAIEYITLDVDPEDNDAPLVSSPLRDTAFPALTSLHLSSMPSCAIIAFLTKAPKLQCFWLNDADDWPDRRAPAINRVIDCLVGANTSNPNPSQSGRSSVLPCPNIKSFCFIECAELSISHVLRLVDAYIDARGDHSRKLDMLHAQLNGTQPSSYDVEWLEKRIGSVDLDADMWPDDPFPDPFDFFLDPFPQY